MPFLHFCIICARDGVRTFGPHGIKPWPEVQDSKIIAGGRVWACDTHREAVAARAEECRPDRPRAAREQPVPEGNGPVSGSPRDTAGGAGQLSLI